MSQQKSKNGKKEELPPIVRVVPDPPMPNRAHTEMKSENGAKHVEK